MTYEKAVNALVEAGLLAKTDAPAALNALESPAIDMTYPAWAEALVKAGLLEEANKKAAVSTMEDAQWAEADDDPETFDEDLAGAGLL
jgi:hypothetical protein